MKQGLEILPVKSAQPVDLFGYFAIMRVLLVFAGVLTKGAPLNALQH